MANTPVKNGLFGFFDVFGCVCSFGNFDLFGFWNMFGKIYCSVCSVDFVEKLCINMFESLCKKCAKILHIWWKSRFCTKTVGKIMSFGLMVEKFYDWFYTRFYRGKMLVLHSFHSVYYYYYYLYRRVREGV